MLVEKAQIFGKTECLGIVLIRVYQRKLLGSLAIRHFSFGRILFGMRCLYVATELLKSLPGKEPSGLKYCALSKSHQHKALICQAVGPLTVMPR